MTTNHSSECRLQTRTAPRQFQVRTRYRILHLNQPCLSTTHIFIERIPTHMTRPAAIRPGHAHFSCSGQSRRSGTQCLSNLLESMSHGGSGWMTVWRDRVLILSAEEPLTGRALFTNMQLKYSIYTRLPSWFIVRDENSAFPFARCKIVDMSEGNLHRDVATQLRNACRFHSAARPIAFARVSVSGARINGHKDSYNHCSNILNTQTLPTLTHLRTNYSKHFNTVRIIIIIII